MGFAATSAKQSPWLKLPQFLVHCAGLAVFLTLVLASLKLDLYPNLEWWHVLLPVAIALFIVFSVFTMAVVVWIYVAFVFLTQGIEVDVECELRLDVLFRTAKICFLGHGYVSLLIASFALLLLKVNHWPDLPLVYPMLPLIVLGMVYIFLAVVFKQPEVDPQWFALVGVSLLSQSLMLVIKLDHFTASKSWLPWAATFTPSWLTYVLLLIYCVMSPLQTLNHAQAEQISSRTAGSADTPYGGAEGLAVGNSSAAVHAQLFKVSGIACWVLGWGMSQALLTLRLDSFYKVSWLGVALPAMLGWILLIVFVSAPVTEYFTDITRLILQTFGLALGDFLGEYDVEDEAGVVLDKRSPLPWP